MAEVLTGNPEHYEIGPHGLTISEYFEALEGYPRTLKEQSGLKPENAETYQRINAVRTAVEKYIKNKKSAANN